MTTEGNHIGGHAVGGDPLQAWSSGAGGVRAKGETKAGDALCQVEETQQSAQKREEEDAQRSFHGLPESISRGEVGSPELRAFTT